MKTDEQLEKQISEEFEKCDRDLADSFTEKNIFSKGFKAAYSLQQSKISELQEKIERLKFDYKVEMTAKNKEIEYLRQECKRLYEPTKTFWNSELQKENEELREALREILKYNGDSTKIEQIIRPINLDKEKV